MAKQTRSSGPILEPEFAFPEVKKTSTQLPDYASIIGLVRYHLRIGFGKKSEKDCIREVAKLVYSKWWHDTVYCLTLNAVVYKITTVYKQFKEGWKRPGEILTGIMLGWLITGK